ncbi:MAG TPA: TIGR03364 family FAD-dependent oxidoreductase, partial [Chitinophagaceae bacterium]|nr:TIGR03364 family FAD-dependent oxidoreductase [Chitinophagaceae bacterium]
ARALSLAGYKVTVIEKSEKAVGASIRNFGMVWPIGQPEGLLFNRAMRSRQIWKDISDSTGMWYNESGSMHLAYQSDEWLVLQELAELFQQEGRSVFLLSSSTIAARFPHVQQKGLLGGLFSNTELIVDPREAIRTTAAYLENFLDIQFLYKTQVSHVETGAVYIGDKKLQADQVWVCSGQDFETLFPAVFLNLPITRCKLQMMRFKSSDAGMKIGTSVCGGLSLIHYKSFAKATSLQKLEDRYKAEMSEYIKYGIHVMVAQNEHGELTVGDSHEYGHSFEPFDSAYINELIFSYLKQMMNCSGWQLIQSWNGIYPKMQNAATEICLSPATDVFILNGLGGAGMTLSFGLAEEMVKQHAS